MTGLLLCGGSILNYQGCKNVIPDNYDLVFCADSGAKHLDGLGIKADYLMGDMDSIDSALLDSIKNKAGVEVFPRNKDLTDSEIIVNKAIELGCGELVFIGAWGSRLDHSIANIFLAERLYKNGLKCIMTDGINTLYPTSSMLSFDEKYKGKIISLIPSSGDVLVSTSGLHYEISGGILHKGENMGISNYMDGSRAEIKVLKGLLMVIVSDENY